jgi:hypothetical protein
LKEEETMVKRSFIRISLAVVVALVVGSGVGLAQSNNCGRVGTWFGQGDSGTTWIAIVTAGMSATVGQINMEWVLLEPTLGGFFPTAVRVTGGKGVWEKVNQNQYKYTWVAYGLDATGQPVYVARTSGFETIAGCDQTNITYTLELFSPEQNIWSDPPFFGAFTGTGVENRMPVVVVTQ